MEMVVEAVKVIVVALAAQFDLMIAAQFVVPLVVGISSLLLVHFSRVPNAEGSIYFPLFPCLVVFSIVIHV